MKAALYIRVSTDEQASEGFSLSAQAKELELYCLKNSVEVVKIYADEGISGQKEDRPQFQKMLSDAEKGMFNIILVHKFDRFARRVELSQKIKTRMKKSNVNVISITEPIEDSPIGFFQEGILELLAEYYIRNLSSEIKKGKVERASQGLHNGELPYGYDYDGEKGLKINEEQAEVVRKIFELYLGGMGYNGIARYLNDSRIPTQTGKKWRHYQTNRILNNSKYAGMLYYSGNYYESKVPAIVDKEKFETVKLLRGNRASKINYNTKGKLKSFLVGILRCGECGCSFRWNFNKKKCYASYGCNHAMRYLGDGICTFTKHFEAKKFEAYILDQVTFLASGINTSIEVKSDTPVINLIDNREIKIKNELIRAKEAYIHGIFDLDEYSEIRKKLELELADMQKTKTIEADTNINERYKQKAQEALEKLNSTDDIQLKKLALMSIVSEIKVYRDRIEITRRI